jgi:uncharacterized YceG family protein
VSDWQQRTANEREAARLERERRRAQERVEEPYHEEEPLDGELDGHEADGGWNDDDEVALGTRRIARGDRIRRERAVPEPAPVRRERQPPRRQRQPRREGGRHSRMGRLLALVVLVVAAAVIWFLVQLFQPFQGSAHGRVTVTIPPHSGAQQIGDQLEREGVISSSFFFNLRAALAGDRGKLLSGTYHLQLGMSYGDTLKALKTPPPKAKVSNLTIIEGRTRRQLDALLRTQKIGSGYLAATRHSPVLKPADYGAPANTPSLEGFLFPDTYQLRDPVTISALVADQLKTFRRQFAKISTAYARSRHLSPYGLLIIASMVQAEAQTSRDRPLIASVIYNRLADHMPLQIDATTRYATGNYTRPLTVSELNSPSPYNTRVHAGLPPTPIGNPGIASLQAAAHPATTNYLYFVVKPCSNGESAFSSSYSAFLADVQKYNAARNRQGGRSPVHC